MPFLRLLILFYEAGLHAYKVKKQLSEEKNSFNLTSFLNDS